MLLIHFRDLVCPWWSPDVLLQVGGVSFWLLLLFFKIAFY